MLFPFPDFLDVGFGSYRAASKLQSCWISCVKRIPWCHTGIFSSTWKDFDKSIWSLLINKTGAAFVQFGTELNSCRYKPTKQSIFISRQNPRPFVLFFLPFSCLGSLWASLAGWICPPCCYNRNTYNIEIWVYSERFFKFNKSRFTCYFLFC